MQRRTKLFDAIRNSCFGIDCVNPGTRVVVHDKQKANVDYNKRWATKKRQQEATERSAERSDGRKILYGRRIYRDEKE